MSFQGKVGFFVCSQKIWLKSGLFSLNEFLSAFLNHLPDLILLCVMLSQLHVLFGNNSADTPCFPQPPLNLVMTAASSQRPMTLFI